MALDPVIKAETNIPLVATLKYLDFYPEKPNPKEPGKMMAEQYGFKGDFDGKGAGRCYISVFQLAADPVALGLAERVADRDGVPQFRWKYPGKIQILKKEEGRKKVFYLSRINADADLPSEPVRPMSPAGLNADGTKPGVGGSMRSDFRALAAATKDDLSPLGNPWAELEVRYRRCAEIATRVWTTSGVDAEISDQALVAATATLFIQSNNQHLEVPRELPATISDFGQLKNMQAAPAPEALPPSENQMLQMRKLIGSQDHYGGGDIFTPEERQGWLAKLGGGSQQSIAQDIDRVQKLIQQRTTKPKKGPGFEDFPEALEAGEDDLPFR